ncbi:MAG: hypothetical protein QOD70_2324 [Frankiales bacterium]|nr:hypothetical protein [Frankiales bacterium]
MRARLLLAAPLLAAACSSHSAAGPVPTPTPSDPCEAATPAPGCITTTPGTATTYPYPADAGRISPLAVPPAFDGELGRKSNNLTPGVRTATLTVTVPAGKVLATDLICQGRGRVVVTTTPVSAAAQTITCDGNQLPSQLGATAAKPEAAATRYVVTLRATGPSRWLVAVSARAPK